MILDLQSPLLINRTKISTMPKDKDLIKIPKEKTESLSEKDKIPLEIQKYVTGIMKSESFSGPIPHPKILKQYNEIVPGSANRIIKMAEKQQSHRIYLEKAVINSDINMAKRGQNFGFIITIGLIIIGTGFVIMGIDIGAYASFISAAGFLIASFIGASKKKERELKEKKED
jgi:uncharacterized membrane protein